MKLQTTKKTKAQKKGQKKNNLPAAQTKVSKNRFSNFRFCHKELIATIESGQTRTISLTPSNSLAFPWFSQVAALFDTYRPLALRFEYVPSCSLMSTTGALTMAIDYDCLDVAAANRTLLSQMAGAVTTQLYKGCVLNADPSSLRLFPKRYCHSTTASDPRLSTIGTLEIISDGTGSTPVGDLFVWYDFELMAPSPTSVNESLVFQNFDTATLMTALPPVLGSAGIFLAGTIPGEHVPLYEGKGGFVSPGLLPQMQSGSIQIENFTVTYGQNTYESPAVCVTEPGLYQVTLTTTPVAFTGEAAVVDIWSLSSGWNLVQKMQRSVNLGTQIVQGVIQVTFEVVKMTSNVMRLFHFFNAAYQYALGGAPIGIVPIYDETAGNAFGVQASRLGPTDTPFLLTVEEVVEAQGKRAAKSLAMQPSAKAECVSKSVTGCSVPNESPYQQNVFVTEYNHSLERLLTKGGTSVECVSLFNSKIIEYLKDLGRSTTSCILAAKRDVRSAVKSKAVPKSSGCSYSNVVEALQARITCSLKSTETTTTATMGGKST